MDSGYSDAAWHQDIQGKAKGERNRRRHSGLGISTGWFSWPKLVVLVLNGEYFNDSCIIDELITWTLIEVGL
jgi:hypothetical protein